MQSTAAAPASTLTADVAFDSLPGRVERDLDNISQGMWKIDGSDVVLEAIFAKLSLLKAQVEVQMALQRTANMLRQHASSRALPKQQATKVKHMIRFVFRKDSRGGQRHRQLRHLDCDALKLCALAYTTDDIAKMDEPKFDLLCTHAAEFMDRRKLSPLLYRPDVDKAVDAKFDDPEDYNSFDVFLQAHALRRVTARKRSYGAMIASERSPEQGMGLANSPVSNNAAPSDSLAPQDGTVLGENDEKDRETKKYGDVFELTVNDAQFALSSVKDVSEIFLTLPWTADDLGRKPPFLTAWLSEELGNNLSKRARLISNATSNH